MSRNDYFRTQLKDGKLHRNFSPLQKSSFRKKPHLIPSLNNLLASLCRQHSDFVKAALHPRREELFPGLLFPFTDKKVIRDQAKKVRDDLERHDKDGVEIDKIWPDFCKFWNLGQLKQPKRKEIFLTRKWLRILTSRVDKASFIYDQTVNPTHRYVSDRYLSYHLSHRPKGAYKDKHGEVWTYSQAYLRKQFCRTSGQFVRSRDIGELAINRGLTPYLVTITPKPLYNRKGSHWQKHTPDQVSKMLSGAFRKFTDSLRQAGDDIEIIRVIEPQRNGAPHMHFVMFIHSYRQGAIIKYLRDAFIHKSEVCGATGVHVKNSHDWLGAIKYVMKQLWGESMADPENQDRINAWSKHGCHRRYGHVSTMYKYPSVKLWEHARKGKALIQKLYPERLSERIAGDEYQICLVNYRLAIAAMENDFASFCKIFWEATASSCVVLNDIKPTDMEYEYEPHSQLRIEYPDNYIYYESFAIVDAIIESLHTKKLYKNAYIDTS